MQLPAPAQLLDLWEAGSQQPAGARVLDLLAACSGESRARLAALSIGARDAQLLELRAFLFGSRVLCVCACPQCAAVVEAGFEVDDLALAGTVKPANVLEHDGYRIRFRLPDSDDLQQVAAIASIDQASDALLLRCVEEARQAGQRVAPSALPAAVADALGAAIAAADPLGEIQLSLTCPTCAHHWQGLFDIARFLWLEFHGWAQRLLQDVSTLAQVFHWSEAAILGLGARRRQAYLELCRP
jgi:hypothetical protein